VVALAAPSTACGTKVPRAPPEVHHPLRALAAEPGGAPPGCGAQAPAKGITPLQHLPVLAASRAILEAAFAGKGEVLVLRALLV